MSQAPTAISQNPDVRYLGKLLGDVIRAYGGQDLFQRIESIRASSLGRCFAPPMRMRLRAARSSGRSRRPA